MSSGYGRLREVLPVTPGGGLVVEGAGLEASVQDSDEAVGQAPQGVVVFDSAGAELVVEGAGAGRGFQCGECLRVERVDEAVVVDEPGGDDLLLPGRAGDGTGGGVVPAGFAVVVDPAGLFAQAVRVKSSRARWLDLVRSRGWPVQ